MWYGSSTCTPSRITFFFCAGFLGTVTDLKLLPLSTSKRMIWKFYSSAAAGKIHGVKYSTLLVPIIIMMSMSDLCAQCQKNSNAIIEAANFPESELSSKLHKYIFALPSLSAPFMKRRVMTAEEHKLASFRMECIHHFRSFNL